MDRARAFHPDGSDSVWLMFYGERERTKINKLAADDRGQFLLGPPAMGFNAAFMGLIANSYWRRLLRVKRAAFASSFPLSFLPFLTTTVAYTSLVSAPILRGENSSTSVAVASGALVGFVVSGVFPVLLTIPPNYRLAVQHRTIELPPQGRQLAFLWRVSKAVRRPHLSFALFQAACCSFMAYTQARAARLDVPDDFP
ncbi:transmembrane protein 126A-like [Petromyzon marinus]|uniref:transmembrane protein 126A-like n=1 Tax=Petromyzon marinus TaxID=7757 RepID=UPI003F7273A2